MRYLVHGATGAQGSPVSQLLLAAGHEVVGGVRHPAAGPGLDLADPAALTAVYQGVDGVFLHLPLATPARQTQYAQSVAVGLCTARPARVVISTSGADPTRGPLATLLTALTTVALPHAVVTPCLFLENLLLPNVTEPLRAHGELRYPLPATLPVSWASHGDVAAVVVELLQRPAPTGVVGVGHLPAVTGPELAAACPPGPTGPVRYVALSPQEFAAQLPPALQGSAAGIQALYAHLGTLPALAIAPATSAQEQLGLHPQPLAQWARQHF
ncbi:NAD(P)H-binding protein [Buchananella hordeovulneris]|uniref:NAD(P)-binding domain-containing protein n=1 Tax=Buchananella hordeovulneris TaxID=52770 RepID=A0A1Q5PZF8_9ACTO|nr:NAD(P)H-binding protein [Buchananella hordeovulneris]OKL52842.1 hypothetical protein BSZ40_01760 [Buchananella hordeovulneris]